MTENQRDIAIASTASVNEAVNTFADLDKWTVRATAALEGRPVNPRRKPYWQGVGNALNRVKTARAHLQGYLPGLNGSKLPPNETLRDWIEEEEEKIRGRPP